MTKSTTSFVGKVNGVFQTNIGLTTVPQYPAIPKDVRYGHNKEHDPSAQLNLLVVHGEQSGLPFYYR
ncbi:hypothetical protein [Schleiferilactobacillus perolens]|uniref:hypothetical protein n=1 Tax=Schleiferilactobacillus perolens TaxID=100468 RepID=UPI002352F99F|nr:hypothetical protein [Schleiferilactobacillus perolens]MCI2171556.1 hypothetical protein [Schleiferilactobacillus perolens]